MKHELWLEMRRRIWERDQGVCGLCSDKIVTIGQMDLDRIVPGFEGGKYEDANVRATHIFCNRSRGGRDGMPRRAASRAATPKMAPINVIFGDADRARIATLRERYGLTSAGAAIRLALRLAAPGDTQTSDPLPEAASPRPAAGRQGPGEGEE